MDNEEKIKMLNNMQKQDRFSAIKNLLSNKYFLIFILGLIVIIGIVFLIDSRTEGPGIIGKNLNQKNIIEDKSPGKVVEADNLEESLPEQPNVIAQGRLKPIEQNVSGKALFIEGEKGIILRFEDFDIINGQNIHVYLSPVLDLQEGDFFDLGLLKATSGNFNYDLDKKIDIYKYNNVIIWSNPFDAFFAYAGLYSKELPPEEEMITEESTKEESSEVTNKEENIETNIAPEETQTENMEASENQE